MQLLKPVRTPKQLILGSLCNTFNKNVDPNIVLSHLKSLKVKNPKRVIIAHLNINSISSKFDQFSYQIRDTVDILLVGETKLNDSVPQSQFKISGFSQPYRRDRNRNGDGVMIFVREELPSKELLKHTFPNDIEALVIEITLRKTKFLFIGGCRPPSQSQNYFFHSITNALSVYSGAYDKFLLAGDFNLETTESIIDDFMYENNLKCIVKDKTCFRNPNNPTSIDLFLTNFSNCFQNTTAICTDLSDFHQMIVTVHKYSCVKAKPRLIHYRCYKDFDNISFRNELRARLSVTVNDGELHEVYLQVLNNHAPIKSKAVRANHAPCMSEALRKAIMRRSYLEG